MTEPKRSVGCWTRRQWHLHPTLELLLALLHDHLDLGLPLALGHLSLHCIYILDEQLFPGECVQDQTNGTKGVSFRNACKKSLVEIYQDLRQMRSKTTYNIVVKMLSKPDRLI